MGNVKIIGASAGSGKTYRLAYEYVKSVVATPGLYRHILAVTFTNKATEEMKSRILQRIHELADPEQPSPYLSQLLKELAPLGEKKIRENAAEAQRLILHDYSRFAVLTIDRFFQRLIRSFIRELGVEVNFNLELETDSLLSLAADALIEQTASDEELRGRLFSVARDRMDENKRWNIKEPLVALGKELFGEEYLRARENDNSASLAPAAPAAPEHSVPEHPELVAPTTPAAPADNPTHSHSQHSDNQKDTSSLIEAVVNKAAEAQRDMTATAKDALAAITVSSLTANDFKGRSRSLVPYLEKVAKGAFIPLSSSAREACESSDPSSWVNKTSSDRALVEGLIPTLQPLLARIDDIYTRNLRLVNSAGLLRENHRNFLLLSDLQQRIERICVDRNIMPISETNRIISRLVGGNDAPFVFEKAGSYFSRFMIDEFQDTSSSQWENFVPLLRNAIADQPHHPVMLIGDIKQAIYRWRGGDWRILSHRVHQDMGADRVDNEMLDTNFRSMRRVVEFNNAIIEAITGVGNAQLDSVIAEALTNDALTPDEASELSGLLARAYLGHTQTPKSDREEGYVTFTVYGADADGEYVPPVIEKVEELQSRGYKPGDIAILVRSNEQGARVAQMLLQRKHDFPDSPYSYDVVTAEALMVGASAVSRFIVACLSLAVDPADAIQRAVYNLWLGHEVDTPLDTAATAFFARIATLSPEEAFEQTVMQFRMQKRTSDIAYIQAVHQQILAFSSRSVADIPLFLKWWNEKGATASITMQGGGEGHNSAGDAITVSTIHKSKGLQYKAVIVPYLSWSMSPDNRGRQLVVWTESSEEGLEGAGHLPINYKESMSQSFFAPRYYHEQVMAHIDAMNMFYVATTRAEEELHLMSSSSPHLGKNVIGNILRGVLCVGSNGEHTATPNGEVITFGTPLYPSVEVAAAVIDPSSVAEGTRETATSSVAETATVAEDTPAVPAETATVAEGTPATAILEALEALEATLTAPALTETAIKLSSYPTASPLAKVKLRLPSARYFGDETPNYAPDETRAETSDQTRDETHNAIHAENFAETRNATPAAIPRPTQATLSPRDFGVLMHRAFEKASDVAEVHRALDIMLADRLLSPAEHAHLQSVIKKAFSNQTVAEWFETKWDKVRNEGSILTPANPSTKRPDRVMLLSDRAVVVDYKFGRTRSPEYAAQLREYMELLRGMGYAQTEGYIWYVSLDEIVTVPVSDTQKQSH